MSEKKNEKKKKIKLSKGAKLYIGACMLSFIIGIVSLGIAGNITRSALEYNENEIIIPSYEEIIKENEKILELQNQINNETKEDIPQSQEKPEAKELEEESVKAVSSAVIQTEKAIIFTAPCEGNILKRFSVDKPLKSKTMGDFRIHKGVDIKADVGSSIYASADGTVERIYEDNLLGLTVVIAHSDTLKTEYSNIAGDDMVKEGDAIKAGQAIGCVGNNAKGELLDDAHLHFSVVEEGIYADPEKYIKFE